MAREYFDDVPSSPAPRRQREYLGENEQPPTSGSAEEQIAAITRRGAKETGYVPQPGAKPAEPIGFGQSVLQSLYGVPALAGGAKLLQLGTRAYPRVAPYATQFAEAMIPKTGKELARATGAVATGTAAAYGAGEVLPPGTHPVVRELTQFSAGATGELPFMLASQAKKAFRPLFEKGVTKAGERVVREFGPQQIETLPEFKAGRGELLRTLREKLRGQSLDVEQMSAQDIADLLKTEADVVTGKASSLAERLAGRVQQRGAKIGTIADETAIGTEARDALDQRLNQLRERRSTNAKRRELVAFGRARQKEAAGLRVNQTEAAQNGVREIDSILKDPQTELPNVTIPELSSQLLNVKSILSGKKRMVDEAGNVVEVDNPVSFQALENLRRFLKDRADGLPAQGYDAIGQQQAGRLTKIIESIQKEFSPTFGKFLEQYRIDSEPINQFRKSLGVRITGKENFDFSEFKTDPARLAKLIFATPTSVENFIELSGNNIALTERLARSYLAGLTEGKSGQEISNIVAKNEWLNLPQFANIKRDFAEQGRLATKAVTRTGEISTAAKEATAPLELGADPAQAFRKILSGPTRIADIEAQAAVLSRTPEGQTAFKQAVRDVLSTTPPGRLRQDYMQKIKPALQASRMYKPDELAFLDKEIIGIDEVNLAVNRAIQKASTLAGTESPERILTRLVQDEVNQMRAGGVIASLIAAVATSAASGVGLPSTGIGAMATGVAAGTLLPRYREYNANIRKVVSDIISDPQRLQQVLSAPKEQQPTILARLLRTGLYSAATATNQPKER